MKNYLLPSKHSYFILKVKIIPLCLLFLINFSVSAGIREFETTRLKSTAGAGVGSILMDEATSLNPAPLAYFNMGSLYIQKTGADFTNKEGDTIAAVVSDAKGSLKGSLSYYKYKENFNSRKQFAVSVASPVLERSAMGVTYRMVKDRLSENGDHISETKYNQMIIGITHAINEHFTLGLIAIDPLKKRENDTRGIIGTQLVYSDFISLMLDAGTDYYRPLREKFLYRGAIQFKVFKDFFVRAGLYKDRGLGEKGTGAGLGWTGPKLVLSAALKSTEIFEKIIGDKVTPGEDIKETSFSLSYKF